MTSMVLVFEDIEGFDDHDHESMVWYVMVFRKYDNADDGLEKVGASFSPSNHKKPSWVQHQQQDKQYSIMFIVP